METLLILNQAMRDYACMFDTDHEFHQRNIYLIYLHLSTHTKLYPRRFYQCPDCLCSIPDYIKESTVHVLRMTCHSDSDICYILNRCLTDYEKELLFPIP